ncbi:MAG TPA: pseudouridine synthase [Spirochaetota bacterium]|nr:pseudouridine synthase [Spirochaetota bacterium]HNT10049.1 pseudouridine synthase [Spirochaetota bacterium]HNV47369.1 pseudouridine synthase [Spirochaetota bacterium]HPI22915.1 pseudouridine synthase [Spirochaetota bacterium]HPU86867.1 pseudouridine synthase [Spirochaetota bacterium]
MEQTLRINKYLARCGLGSRRKVEQLVLDGKVSVNGTIIRDLASCVDPERDTVALGGEIVKPSGRRFYLVLNKPRGYVTTVADDRGRPIVMDLLPERYRTAGVVPVGRLDQDTEGLLFLTNDGDLAHRLLHPRFHVEKEYLVELDRDLDDVDRARIEKGIMLYGHRTRPARIEFPTERRATVLMAISEGKKRQIRLTFKAFGYTVKLLRRITFATLSLARLPRGMHRALRPGEVKKLMAHAGCAPEPSDDARK